MKYSEFIARVLAVLNQDRAAGRQAIERETEPQVLTQAMDVADQPQRQLILQRLGQLAAA